MDRDADLLRGLKERDVASFDRFFRRYQDRVYGFVAKMVGPDAAADVTQDVFLEAYRSIGRFRGDSALKTWLFRIAVHMAHKHRRRRRDEAPLDEARAGGAASVAEGVEASERAARLARALERLPDEMREAVLLNKILGFSYVECAQVARCPLGTIKSRLAKAMARLRAMLTEESENV